jgi:class 3 adenylate cyclase
MGYQALDFHHKEPSDRLPQRRRPKEFLGKWPLFDLIRINRLRAFSAATAGRSIERRLVAILAADVVGYSLRIAEDEEGTIQAMRALHSAAAFVVAAEGGRIIGTPGDFILSEFSSVVGAVRCGIALQDATNATGLELRIGIHQGEIGID